MSKLCQTGDNAECLPGCENLASKCLRLPVESYDWCQALHKSIAGIAEDRDWRWAARYVLTRVVLQLREWSATTEDRQRCDDETYALIKATFNTLVVLADSAATPEAAR